MKIFVLAVLFVCIAGTHCGLKHSIKNALFRVEKTFAELVRDKIEHKPVTSDKVTFYLFNKTNPNKYIGLNRNNLDELTNPNAKVVFLVHGWTNSREIEWYEDVKNAFLNREEEYYVVQVDWKEPAKEMYTIASVSTYDVGKHISGLIIDLLDKHCRLENILIVGHSLGGQIAGFVGKHIKKSLGKSLPRIICLDPAGPIFNARTADKRLNSTDAEVVHVIHTDGGLLGYKSAIGTIDFFPNGGSSQPGCKSIDLGHISSIKEPAHCDHQRSCSYFSEAILNPHAFMARKCKSWSEYPNKCENVTVAMGDIFTHETGKFYLKTNKEKPFSKRESTEGSNIINVLQH